MSMIDDPSSLAPGGPRMVRRIENLEAMLLAVADDLSAVKAHLLPLLEPAAQERLRVARLGQWRHSIKGDDDAKTTTV